MSWYQKESLPSKPSVISGGTRISQTGGGGRGGAPTYYLAKLTRKLHENEENWTEGKGGASKILLCKSATGYPLGRWGAQPEWASQAKNYMISYGLWSNEEWYITRCRLQLVICISWDMRNDMPSKVRLKNVWIWIMKNSKILKK